MVSQMGALHYSTLVQMQDHIQESFDKNVHFHYGFHLNPSHDILATILILGNIYTIKSFFLVFYVDMKIASSAEFVLQCRHAPS